MGQCLYLIFISRDQRVVGGPPGAPQLRGVQPHHRPQAVRLPGLGGLGKEQSERGREMVEKGEVRGKMGREGDKKERER